MFSPFKVYELAGEIAGLDKQTVLLDVCCGTGTIGICLAGKCKEVSQSSKYNLAVVMFYNILPHLNHFLTCSTSNVGWASVLAHEKNYKQTLDNNNLS
jgi:hypothetical protein